MDKLLARLIRGQKERRHKLSKSGMREVISTDSTNIKKIVRECMPINQTIQIKYTDPLIDRNYQRSLKKKSIT